MKDFTTSQIQDLIEEIIDIVLPVKLMSVSVKEATPKDLGEIKIAELNADGRRKRTLVVECFRNTDEWRSIRNSILSQISLWRLSFERKDK